ncbi:hypothetical protein EXIGLDRAFT_775039 [Exidia glandulosa HHB12029]|uniref:Uncharacterized protein n=1 Tax=Exidia glandulosa HHB12029 TaxID=1314781 RepID=A0A165E304_EXIGL|nr:hypothetical protein EXIGLDRAFT_775039 [Exidia glandulosa HHB12029]
MAIVPRRQPSALVSNGLSVATTALNVAGAATDAVPIAKQILNSAAHISAVAEKIQKKREAMYTLVEKADIYATQIDISVAGRVPDASLKRRLERLYSVFLKIEALVSHNAGSKKHPMIRLWQTVITKPIRAETLVVELDREIQLFEAWIQLSLVVDDTARAIAADARYDGQIRLLRDCDIEKRKIIMQCATDEGTVTWASARVDGELMVIRYLESSSIVKRDENVVAGVSLQQRAPYIDYLENIKRLSTVLNSHPHIVQLYGRHVQGPTAVFRSGIFSLASQFYIMTAEESCGGNVTAKRLRLAYKILDAVFHLEEAHGLVWVGKTAVVDENGEPRIGLFDDIVQADPEQLPPRFPQIYFDILLWFDSRRREETGIVEQVHDCSLHARITEQLRGGTETGRLRQVWAIIRQEQLFVSYNKTVFPIISGKCSLSQEMIARAQLHFEATAMKDVLKPIDAYLRYVLAGGCASLSSAVRVATST